MISMASDIASAMHYLHSLTPALIHRDIKSANILMDKLTCKLCDFGVADFEGQRVTAKQEENIRGTPGYMSPESFDGKYSTKTDVYSFGVLFWEIYTRDGLPFEQYSAIEVWEKVKKGDRPAIPSICPRNIQRYIERLWSQDPKERPSFAEIITSLRSLSERG
eukprot:TRINITY_DN4430_c0_g1_i1.p1 TRINITY_DN4430_c0_g1~~TRINITY_DN4430_c0_g1_i1.p1  ORF type:complete len:163 (+),score=28.07 TRINITY_DN4430_c0_g1_i1:300-788(+)